MRFLRTWLQRRKFAYEQTLAFLIYAISEPQVFQEGHHQRPWNIEKVKIGKVVDYEGRGFRQATDQVERTERVLRLLWREAVEAREDGHSGAYQEFVNLDQRSTAIRVNALVCFGNILR